MDAKAKVVGWQYRRIDLDEADGIGPWKDCSENDYIFLSRAIYMQSHELRKLIPLPDHEAALAAIREELQFAQIRGDDWRAKFDADTDVIRDLKQQITTLLTGLEALAGEVRRIQARANPHPDDDDADRKRNLFHIAKHADDVMKKLLTLTNSAKENNDG